MGDGNRFWQKTEGGSGGGRGHSNMAHWEHTGPIKDGARRARRRQDRVAVDGDELDELPLTAAQVKALLRASDRDIDV